MLPRGLDCPDILLAYIRGLVGEGDPRSSVPIALQTLLTVRQHVLCALGEYPGGVAPEGRACMLCCCVFPPPGAVCPSCGCVEWLDQEGPGPAAVRWLAGFRTIILEHCPFLRSRPCGALLLHSMFWVAQAWVTHVNHRLGRWQRDCFPSAPIVWSGGIICMWRLCTGSPGTSLGKVPACDRWAYAVGDDGLRLVRVRRHLEVPWAARAVLVGPGCGQCGRVLMLDALLDLPGPGHGD